MTTTRNDLVPAPNTEADFEFMLMSVLDGLRYVHPDDCPGDLADAAEQMDDGNVNTNAAAGLMTRNRGLVVRLRNGAEFQITIVQSERADEDDDEDDDEEDESDD